jgi:hypothetical protein
MQTPASARTHRSIAGSGGVCIGMTTDIRHFRSVLALAAFASLMVALDTLVVSTALSTIRLDLGASIAELEWTVNAYNLSLAVLLNDRRRARRPVRPAAHVRGRPRHLRRRLGGVRAGSRRRHADRSTRRAGRRGGARDAAQPGARRRGVSARAPRQGARHLLRRDGPRGASGPVVGGAIAEGLAWQWTSGSTSRSASL